MTTNQPFPTFRYHPEPVESGSVVPHEAQCEACGHVRSFMYVGPVYSAEVEEPLVCVWCIADGSAARQWDAIFTDPDPWAEAVPDSVANEVLTRTPGFSGWQQEHWMAHCGDAAVFLGRVGARELGQLPDEVTEALLTEAISTRRLSRRQSRRYIASLDRDRPPTAYLFRCAHCESYLGYSDFD